MNNKLLKKEIFLSSLTLIIFAISQYILRMQMFIYSDDAEVADKILKMGWGGMSNTSITHSAANS